MKRIGNLYEQIISVENLQLADKKARKGKTHSYGVISHDKNQKENIRKLHKSLESGKFDTSPYVRFTIHDPKEREIFKLPYYPDRIVHHAIMNVMEPIWVSCLIKNTYSCIKGRGVHGAVRDLKKDLMAYPNDTKYCLKIDVRKFYPSIDNTILKTIIRKKIKDVKLLKLLDNIIDSTEGVPIGNYLSQYFANLYLCYFDHWMKEEIHCKFYYRYADDAVILNSSKEVLHEILDMIKAYFRDVLHLTLNDNYQIFPIKSRGIDFIGYRFYHTHTLLRKRIKQSFFRKIAKLNKLNLSKAEYKQAICSYKGWLSYCNSHNLRKYTYCTIHKKE